MQIIFVMNGTQSISFVLRAQVDGLDITPASIGFSLFNKFNREVEDFLAGSGRKVPLNDAKVSIENGSYRLVVLLPALVANMVSPDIKKLKSEDALHEIDPRRASIVRLWQDMTRKDQTGSVSIESAEMGIQPIRISSQTDYHAKEQNEWVAVEKYVTGRIVDIGGISKANVHLVLDDGQRTLIAASSEDYLRDQKENYLYRQVQLQISAQENIRTGELRDVQLLSFAGGSPSFDEGELDKLIDKGTKAWAGVSDSVAWVREQRGGYGE